MSIRVPPGPMTRMLKPVNAGSTVFSMLLASTELDGS
jgi:hypothetical protein